MVANAPAVQPARQFVPRKFDASDWSQIEPLGKTLLDRQINSAGDLEKWLLDYSELTCVLDEYRARRYIDMSCHTDDGEIEQRYMQYVETIEPKFKPVDFALKKKFVESSFRSRLSDRKFAILSRHWEADVTLFRDENVPIETELTKLTTDYDKITGAMMVEFRGEQCTMPRLAKFLESPDRKLREEAWIAFSGRRLADREKIEAIFDAMLPLRETLARNAGLNGYREFIWLEKKRFDYTPADCNDFAEAIADCCVPVMRKLEANRARDLRLERLRPWDLSVDPKGRPALQPFAADDMDGFVAMTRDVFARMSATLGDQFDSLRQNQNLDLESRKGKAPGGYQESLNESRQPFIFMNATGTQRDVETLLHEGGHAFHALAASREPLVFLRHAPMEFCEVASMSMELLAHDHLGAFYSEADRARAQRKHLESIVTMLPWIVTIDQFQHWIYGNPGHSRAARTQRWLDLRERFGPKLDWTGLEPQLQSAWQAQLHLFHVPFYYVEYGIAQLGALQLWLKARSDPNGALSSYRAALALGGTRSLPELFAAAGIHFDFSAKTLRPLMDAVQEELESLPV